MAAEVPERMTPGMRLVARGVGVLFLLTGALKLVGLSGVKDFFLQLGLPGWMVVVAGLAELVLGGLMFARRTWQYGAVAILVWMVFAALSHVMTGEKLWLLFFNAVVINVCMWLLEKNPPGFLDVRKPRRASLGRE